MDFLEAREMDVAYAAAPPILAELTISLRGGELVGIVGPNGAGKSTLVRALSRALEPTRGCAILGERDLYHQVSAREAAQQIAVVPQDTTIAFDFSVQEVVEMGRTPRLPRRPFASLGGADEVAVAVALELAGVSALAERTVTTLSGGERQRVLLARALAQAGDVLLLDEPTAHLDLRHQAETLALVRDLAHTQGKAALAVLHDLNLAAAYCDRIVLLHEGRIAALGSPWDVLTQDNLSRVYQSSVWVRRHPLTGRPYLLPLPTSNANPLSSAPRVLVLCGSGTGSVLMAGLLRDGFRVVAGGLNVGDADAETAAALGIPFPGEAPFTPLSSAVIAQTERLAHEADAVVLTETPFGPANIALLSVALMARQAGKPLICVQSPNVPFQNRDFTGGVAFQVWESLASAGAVMAADADAAQSQVSAVLTHAVEREQMPLPQSQ